MSFIPHLRRPIGTKVKGSEDHVRFADEPETRYSRTGRHPTRLTRHEKEARKEDALRFLRRRNENLGGLMDNGGISRRLRTSSYAIDHPIHRDRDLNKRTYELMRESPIRRIPNPQSLNNDNVLRSVRREASSNLPILNNRKFTTSTTESPRKRHGGLLDSLSSVGSRLLNAALFNERKEDRKLRDNDRNINTDSLVEKWDKEELKRINANNELERQIRQKRRLLEQLNSSIRRSEWKDQDTPTRDEFNKYDLEAKMDKLENAIKTLHGSTSKEDVLKELGAIRQELLGMKSRQESNNMKFESRMEELQLEAQLNLRRYKKMLEDLGRKRNEIEKQKDEMIKMLRQAVRKKRKRREVSDSGSEEEEEEEDDDYDFPAGSKSRDYDKDNIDLSSDSDSISEFENEKSPKHTSKLSPTHTRGRKRRKTTSSSIRSKLNKITKRMKSMEHDVSNNRHQAKKLQEEI